MYLINLGGRAVNLHDPEEAASSACTSASAGIEGKLPCGGLGNLGMN